MRSSRFAAPLFSNENTNGLVTWWPFDDGTATDFSGSADQGTLTNSPTVVGRPVRSMGLPSNALKFNGTNNYVASNQVVVAPLVTMSIWVQGNVNPSTNGLIAGFINGLNGGQYDKDLVMQTDGTVIWYVFDGGAKTVYGTTIITDNKPHLICGVADGTNAILYVDGVMDGSIAAGATYTGYTLPNVFVNGQAGIGTYLDCISQDLRVYNRGLSPAEINALYNRGIASVDEGEIPMLGLFGITPPPPYHDCVTWGAINFE